jgi:nitrogen regulatory protein P-II 1
MKLVTAIIRPSRVLDVKDVLSDEPIERFTVTDVMGCGAYGRISSRKSTIEVDLLKNAKIEIEVSAESVRSVIDKIINVCRSGKPGDGKIFVATIPECISL